MPPIGDFEKTPAPGTSSRTHNETPSRNPSNPRAQCPAPDPTEEAHETESPSPRRTTSIMSNLSSWEDDPSAQQDENLARQAQQQLNVNHAAQAQAQGGFRPGFPTFQPGAQSFQPGAQSFQPGQAYGGGFMPQYQQQQQYYQQGYQQYGQYGGQQQQGYNQYGQYGGYNQGYGRLYP